MGAAPRFELANLPLETVPPDVAAQSRIEALVVALCGLAQFVGDALEALRDEL